jgi:predicted house-cleaning noncanonical NTP pyrophosphatase (MazG superfamily)
VSGKLVRDGIPALVRADGREPLVRVLGDEEYRRALLDKLLEEVEEVRAASPDDVLEELADVLEVLRSLARTHGWSWQDVVDAAEVKRTARGGFSDRLFLER